MILFPRGRLNLSRLEMTASGAFTPEAGLDTQWTNSINGTDYAPAGESAQTHP